MLQERFEEFSRETRNIGTQRVANVNRIADNLIEAGHTDSSIIAEWKDQLNESWADLLELMETRTMVSVHPEPLLVSDKVNLNRC